MNYLEPNQTDKQHMKDTDASLNSDYKKEFLSYPALQRKIVPLDMLIKGKKWFKMLKQTFRSKHIGAIQAESNQVNDITAELQVLHDQKYAFLFEQIKCPTALRCINVVTRALQHFDDSIRYHFTPSSDDKYWTEGAHVMARQMHHYVCKNEPILAVLPAFPCKSPNAQLKVLGTLPDRAEEIALKKLHAFCSEVSQYYPKGAQLTIVSDGRVFADLVGVDDELVTKYTEFLKTHIHGEHQLNTLRFSNLDEHFANNLTENGTQSVHDRQRSRLMKSYCSVTPSNDVVMVGFVRYLADDRVWPPEMSKSKIKKECRLIAKEMIARNVAFSQLVEACYPNHVRFSIHGYDSSGPKFPINVAPNRGGSTPWHSVAIDLKDGRQLFVRRTVADELVNEGQLELYNHPIHGRPWGYRQISNQKLLIA
ncbi:Pyoverdine/dityrosine biosynthesis protein-domain-containing protein [Radiomyces spectabilis]|uniref:Pyoverdine/dityrosine biosynthesis protein-domain-containing protein n=1 Tax=Radiomyces spectabilis TaxID=64574 RepID=UPI002220F0F6|nr:Pyoverdine/dityrosine biosynthesis protein-domain-containing protein [Radiomyces spectabilis]KAI8394225.1 Pyoverdine/dityrosine biosynthesis protein-domain-containing protein [Radiomyces spectabilis]